MKISYVRNWKLSKLNPLGPEEGLKMDNAVVSYVTHETILTRLSGPIFMADPKSVKYMCPRASSRKFSICRRRHLIIEVRTKIIRDA
jgi:hypothetical protein